MYRVGTRWRQRRYVVAGELEDQLCRLGADRCEVLANARQRRGGQRPRLGVVKPTIAWSREAPAPPSSARS